MVASSLSNEWVAFNSEGDASGFEAIVPPSTASARRSSRAHRGDSVRSRSTLDNNNADSPTTVATWMKQPINSDASWAPVAPPASRSHKEEHPTANKKRPPRNRTDPQDSSSQHRRQHKQQQNLNGPNPVSSDSSSSSSRPKRAKSKSRSKHSERSTTRSPQPNLSVNTSPQPLRVNTPVAPKENIDGGSGGNANHASQEIRQTGSSSSSSGRRSRSKASSRSSSKNKPRAAATTGGGHTAAANVPSEHGLSSRTASEVSRESTRESRQGKETSSRRGRSRTRNAEAAATQQQPFRSPEPVPTLQQPPAVIISRGRSSSRTRSMVRERSSSATRRNNLAPAPASSARPRSRSRPPATGSAHHRSRSTSRTPVTRSRSVSRQRTSKPPPSTSRTRREMMRVNVGSSHSVSGASHRRPSGSNRSMSDDNHSLRSCDPNIGRDISFGRTHSTASKPLTPKRSQFMEKLFGDQVSEDAKHGFLPRADFSPTNGSASSVLSWQQPERIHSRILLTATVYHNTATNLWIATINTNQKGVAKNPATASKFLKAFSFSSEKEARESAIANAPPKMMKFEDHPNCFICRGKFAMFRRACHCRNCGVCICGACATTWPAKMIPDTYNLKRESTVKICKTCNYLSSSFKKALLDGDYEEAIALYGSGNINLRTPFPQFSKKKEEVMYPIHCAVEGGNIDIVRWLMEDHFCPVKVIRTGSGKRTKKGGSPDFPILTSKNRSVLSIALESLHVEIMRYLVVDNNVSIYESKDLKASLRALEAVLLALPGGLRNHTGDDFIHRWDDAVFDGETSVASSLGVDLTQAEEDGVTTRNKRHGNQVDACIICYDNAIDCVITPCGHQICCLECSKNLSACPVCNMQGDFIKIFRP